MGKKYSKKSLCTEAKQLFPQIIKKGLDIELHHYDDLAGKVCIESDGGSMEEALKNFMNEWKQGGLRRNA